MTTFEIVVMTELAVMIVADLFVIWNTRNHWGPKRYPTYHHKKEPR